MGVVLPDWADEVLDLIGVSWPNVDEDDYRDMATAMREFAEDIDGGATEIHNAVQDFLTANQGIAVDAFNAHWAKVKGTHLHNLAEAGRLAATAMDGVAVLIEGAKLAAIVQLGILAAEIIAAQAAAPFTFGLSELGALGATQATRLIIKRAFKEVCDQIVDHIVGIAMTPIEEALGSMAGDLVVQLGSNALGLQDGVDLGRTARAGKEGLDQGAGAAKGQMQLLSAESSGGGGGAGDGFGHDGDSYTRLSGLFTTVGGDSHGKAHDKLTRAKTHQSRTRGRDTIANTANNVLDKVVDGIRNGVTTAGKHVSEVMPKGLDRMAKNHRDNDDDTALSMARLRKGADDRTPVYLMSDDGTVRRLHPDGSTRQLTDDDKSRMGLTFDGDNAGRAGPGEPTLKLKPRDPKDRKNARPLTNSRQVPLGSTPLSQAVQSARHSDKSYGTHRDVDGQDKFESNNYAAARMNSSDRDGDFVLVARSSGFRHSERMIGFPVLRDGAGGRMSELYTERAPCSSGVNCSAWMREKLPGVDVSHSIDYGSTRESRAQGNAEMMDYLDRLKSNRHR